MYTQKTPKNQLPDKNAVTHYYPHDIDIEERSNRWTGDYYHVISIDPGRTWFGFRREARPVHAAPSVKYFHPYTLDYEQVSFKGLDTDSETGLCMLYSKVSDYLDKFEQYFDDIHFVIIERQMTINYKMVRLSQHIISYFHLRLKNRPMLPSILEVDSKLKTNELGSPKGLNKLEVKKWAITKAYELLAARSDDLAISILNGAKKKDEYGDTVCQIEACFKYYNLPLTHERVSVVIEMDVPDIPDTSKDNNDSDEDEVITLPGFNSGTADLNTVSLRDIISSVSGNRGENRGGTK